MWIQPTDVFALQALVIAGSNCQRPMTHWCEKHMRMCLVAISVGEHPMKMDITDESHFRRSQTF
jgi:hypothetical protein